MPRPEPTPENPALLILNAVALHERQCGVGSLALVLKGSKSKRVFDRKLYESRLFGALLYHPIDVIENFIKQLIQQGHLITVNIGHEYPLLVLQLTGLGKQVIEQKQDIPLQEIRTTKPAALNESVQTTLDLFKQVKNIPLVATQRELAEGTVWKHLIDAVKLGLLQPEDVVNQQKIQLIIETNTNIKPKGLKDIKNALPETISYDEIRCVLAGKNEHD